MTLGETPYAQCSTHICANFVPHTFNILTEFSTTFSHFNPSIFLDEMNNRRILIISVIYTRIMDVFNYMEFQLQSQVIEFSCLLNDQDQRHKTRRHITCFAISRVAWWVQETPGCSQHTTLQTREDPAHHCSR